TDHARQDGEGGLRALCRGDDRGLGRVGRPQLAVPTAERRAGCLELEYLTRRIIAAAVILEKLSRAQPCGTLQGNALVRPRAESACWRRPRRAKYSAARGAIPAMNA